MIRTGRLDAAIKKLEGLVAESTQGEWLLRFLPGAPHIGGDWPVVIVDGVGEVINSTSRTFSTIADAELIVTMHRMLAAQLDMLREARQYANDWESARVDDRGHDPITVYRPEFRIAAEILGVRDLPFLP